MAHPRPGLQQHQPNRGTQRRRDSVSTDQPIGAPAAEAKWSAERVHTRLIPLLDYDTEIRQVICSTNAIESLNARYRRAVKARGHFPCEQAALKCLYLVTRSLGPTGTAGHDGPRGRSRP